jgi:hypothetical protein
MLDYNHEYGIIEDTTNIVKNSAKKKKGLVSWKGSASIKLSETNL